MTTLQQHNSIDLAAKAGAGLSWPDSQYPPFSLFPHLLLSVILLFMQPVAAQQAELDDAGIDLDVTALQLDQLQISMGRLDPRLLEPLEVYSDQLSDAGQYQQALDILDQALQITRISEGLYDGSQFSLLIKKIEILGKRNDWRDAQEWMDHLSWLLTRSENAINEELIDSFMRLSELHLSSVAQNQPAMQGYHFSEAARANQLAIQVAMSLWGRYDLRLPPLLYRKALQHYLQVRAINAGGKTSLSLRKVPGTEFVRPRGDARMSQFFTGLSLLSEIRNIYLNQQEPDLQAIALSELYIADWNVMFVNPQAAEISYRSSFDGLLRAGIDRQEINRFFAVPAILPALSLVTSWEQLVSQNNTTSLSVSADGEGVRFNYQEWSRTFPFVRTPLAGDLMNSTADYEENAALFSFSLLGLEEVARWYQGRRKKSISAPSDLELLNTGTARSFDREVVEDMIGDFRFRPKLLNGIPQTVNATLQYQFATE